MKTYNYSIKINKPVAFVFEKMMDKSIYSDWARAWGEGLTYTGEWKPGEHLIFGDDKGGTKALVLEMQSPEYVKLKHVAMVNAEGEEQEDETTKKWLGTLEEYYFKPDGEQTLLEVVMVMDEVFEEMGQAWPKALEYLKEICEA